LPGQWRGWFSKTPARSEKFSEEERDYIIGGQESQHQTNNGKKMSVWQILGTRQFWGIALPRFLAEPAWGPSTPGSRCSCLKSTALT
jgi:ACS family hexuronate transporter-like MFS transporter